MTEKALMEFWIMSKFLDVQHIFCSVFLLPRFKSSTVEQDEQVAQHFIQSAVQSVFKHGIYSSWVRHDVFATELVFFT